jgi:exosortase
MSLRARRYAFFAALVGISVMLFWKSVSGLVAHALHQESSSHIILIPVISLYLLHSEREKISQQAHSSPGFGIALILAGLVIHLFASAYLLQRSGNDFLPGAALSLVLVWIGGFLLCYGYRAARAAAFPLLLLFLMVPLPDKILAGTIFLLRKGSTEIAYLLFRAVNVPVLKQEFLLFVPGVTIEVAKECSGIRSSMALFLTCLLAAHLFLRTRWKMALFIILAFPLAIIKNGIRIVTLTLLSTYVDPSFLKGSLHHNGGFVFFLLALFILLPVLLFLEKSESHRRPLSCMGKKRTTLTKDFENSQTEKYIHHQTIAKSKIMMTCDVTILGAGPYGLSAAAHLRTISGLEVRVFGEPMSFWERNMPVGMFLRSNWTATQIADPNRSLTLEAYQMASGNHLFHPVPLNRFVQYGKWYQREAVPDLDQRKIVRIESDPKGFRVILADGSLVVSRRVVIAAGIGSFAWRPREFECLPPSLSSHTSEHRNLPDFAGKQVLVIGGGQSALESAALLQEAGAEVEVVARSRQIHWLQGWTSKTLHHRLGKFVNQLLYAPTDVGPAGISQLMARPDLLRRLPRRLRDMLWKRSVRPAGARWLVKRLQNVPIQLGRTVASAIPVGDKVRVRMDDGSERTVHHVLLGTGYRIDISKYEFLAPELAQWIRRVNGYPLLQKGLETSVQGLHILGAPAAWSFGPLMQFVSGTHYASRSLTRYIASKGRTA